MNERERIEKLKTERAELQRQRFEARVERDRGTYTWRNYRLASRSPDFREVRWKRSEVRAWEKAAKSAASKWQMQERKIKTRLRTVTRELAGLGA